MTQERSTNGGVGGNGKNRNPALTSQQAARRNATSAGASAEARGEARCRNGDELW